MRLGALLGPTLGTGPGEIADQASMLADEGFESLWGVQVIGRGFMAPDPLIALAVAATVTTGVELGTANSAVASVPPNRPCSSGFFSATNRR